METPNTTTVVAITIDKFEELVSKATRFDILRAEKLECGYISAEDRAFYDIPKEGRDDE